LCSCFGWGRDEIRESVNRENDELTQEQKQQDERQRVLRPSGSQHGVSVIGGGGNLTIWHDGVPLNVISAFWRKAENLAIPYAEPVGIETAGKFPLDFRDARSW
jgi:hypothetical protein